jgi:two-component system cell cycle sensor histidine kinase/response regulator CckA
MAGEKKIPTRSKKTSTLPAKSKSTKKTIVSKSIESDTVQADQSIPGNEATCQCLIESISDVAWRVTPDLHFTYISPAFEFQQGYKPEEVIGRSVFDFMTPSSAARIRDLARARQERIRQGERVGRLIEECEQVCRDGRIIWTEIDSNPVYGPDGSLTGFQGITRDITERKKSEDFLRAREAKYRAVIETSVDGFWLADAEGRILEVNDAYIRRSGYSNKELLNMRISDLDAQETPDETAAHIKKVFSEGSDLFESLHRAKDGTLWQVEVNASYWPIAGGRFFIFVRDIAHRKHSEMLLRTRMRLSELADRESLDKVLQAALDTAELHSGSSIGFFHFVDDDQEHLTLQTWSSRTLKKMCTAEGKGQHYPISRAGVWIDCFHTRKPVIHNDYASLALRKGLPDGHAPLIRELVVPIIRNGKVAAIMGVGNKTTDYVQDDVNVVAEIASLVMDLVFRKRSEETLRVNESQLRNAQQLARIGNWRYDVVNKSLWWSDELYRLFEVRPEDGPITMARFLERVHPDDRKTMESQVASAALYRTDYRIVLPDGKIKYMHEEVRNHRDGDGKLIGYSGTAQDVSDLKLVEERLRKNKENLKKAEKIARLGNWEWNIVTGKVLWSDEVYRIYGVDPLTIEPSYDIMRESIAPESREWFNTAMEEAAKRGTPFEGEFRIIGLDGKERFAAALGEVNRDQEGRPTSIFGIVRDISERKRAEAEKEKYYKFFQTSADLMVIADPHGAFMKTNPACTETLGYSEKELVARPFIDFVHPGDKQATVDEMARQLERGFSVNFENRYRCKDGSFRWLSWRAIYNKKEGITYATARDITERKLAEEALRHNQERMEALYNSITDALFVHSALPESGQRFLEVNDVACRRLGYTREELLLLSPKDIDAPDSDVDIEPIVEQIATGKSVVFEQVHVAKDGRRIPVEISAKLFTLEGQPAVLSVVRDITERKRAEEQLQKSEAALLESQRVAHIGNWDWDARTDTIQWSRELFHIFNMDPDLLPREYLKHLNLYTPESSDRLDLAVKNTLETGEPYMLDLEVAFPMTEMQWVAARGEVTRGSRGEIIGLHGTAQDITKRKLAEDKIRQGEIKYRELFELTTDGIFILDLDGRFLDVNRTAYKRLGYTREEMLAMHISNLTPPEFARQIPERMSQICEHGIAVFESAHRRKDGTLMPVEVNSQLIEYEGRAAHFSVIRDITEHKQAEEKILQSEQFIRGILDTVDEGFIVIDRDYRILTVNKAYCNQVGGCDEEIIGSHCYEITHKRSLHCSQSGEECAPCRVFETGKPHAVLHRHTDAEGNILYVETKAFPIKDSSGVVTSVIETLNNITEKYLLEGERLKTQKLESIGTLAGGIAHDFNNLLQGVFGYISMAKMTFEQKEKSFAMLEQAEKALHQSVNLTTQLLTFSKGGKPVTKLIDLRPVIENSAKFTLSGSRSDVHMNIPKDLWQVEADEGQLGQVIQNIVLNADQAMPTGGTVMLSAANVAEGDSSRPPGLKKGNFVMIAIQDTGVGIPEQFLSKVFDPYFTTKDKGSGLGLATSYSIVKNHGGMIDIRTKSGEGSTFKIYLPASEGRGRGETVTVSTKEAKPRTANVLVMDDEEIIRNLSCEIIKTLGHTVEVAVHGQEALEKYQGAMAAGRPFDIVILDLTVRGGMGGSETLQKLLELDPGVKAIVSSGYSDDFAMTNYEKQGFKAFLKKPYNVDALRVMLNEMLAG